MTALGTRLLIMSCSRSKRPDQSTLPAIERYDGPAFRVLRRFLSIQQDNDLTIYVLSAEFGLIPSNRAVPNYDRCMTPQRAELLRPTILGEIERVVTSTLYHQMCVCIGQKYFKAIEGYESTVNAELDVTLATGGPGERLSRLHKWLYGASVADQLIIPLVSQTPVYLGGIEYSVTKHEAHKIALTAICQNDKKAMAYTTWYVEVDGARISPKWLVSKLTGVGVSEFHTDAARKFLLRCGVEVKKI